MGIKKHVKKAFKKVENAAKSVTHTAEKVVEKPIKKVGSSISKQFKITAHKAHSGWYGHESGFGIRVIEDKTELQKVKNEQYYLKVKRRNGSISYINGDKFINALKIPLTRDRYGDRVIKITTPKGIRYLNLFVKNGAIKQKHSIFHRFKRGLKFKINRVTHTTHHVNPTTKKDLEESIIANVPPSSNQSNKEFSLEFQRDDRVYSLIQYKFITIFKATYAIRCNQFDEFKSIKECTNYDRSGISYYGTTGYYQPSDTFILLPKLKIMYTALIEGVDLKSNPSSYIKIISLKTGATIYKTLDFGDKYIDFTNSEVEKLGGIGAKLKFITNINYDGHSHHWLRWEACFAVISAFNSEDLNMHFFIN